MDSGHFIQEAVKKMKKGALTAQAKAHGETPMEFAKEVLAEPEKFAKKTRKRAQFAINIQKHSDAKVEPKMEMEMKAPEHHKKAKRAPSAWNKIASECLKKHGKGHFKEAMAEAKAMYAKHKEGHKAEAPAKEKKPRKPRAKKEPKEPKASSRVRQIELHI